MPTKGGAKLAVGRTLKLVNAQAPITVILVRPEWLRIDSADERMHMRMFAALTAACFAAAVLASSPTTAHAGPKVELPPSTQGTVTYVDFWASWCAPCAQSFPWLNQIQAKYGERGLRVIGVGVDEDDMKAQRFLQAHPAQFEIVRDAGGALAERYAVEGMPYAVILDTQGRVIHRHIGYNPDFADEYERSIQAALAAKAVSKP